MPRALPPQLRQDRASDVEQPEDVGGKHALDLASARLLDSAEQSIACIVDEDVNPPELLQRERHRLVRVLFLGDVELDGQEPRMLAEPRRHRLRIPRRGNDGIPSRQRLRRDQSPEATRSARDEPDTHDELHRCRGAALAALLLTRGTYALVFDEKMA